MRHIGGVRRSGILFFFLLFLGKIASAAQPYIDMGPLQDPLSPDMRWAYVNVEMSPSLGPYGSTENMLGIPAAHNRLILDTGANSALFVAEAAAELESRGIVDVGDYVEMGVSGAETYNVSAPYRYQFWGTTSSTRYTLSPDGGTQVMYNSAADIGGRLADSLLYSVPGILGMPAMTGRVTTLDMRPWITSEDFSYMDTSFSQIRPTVADHRYSVELRADPHFDPVPPVPGGPTPVWANVPFATVRGQVGNVSAAGNFLIDTGANSSLLSTEFAARLGLDSNHDGKFDSQDENWFSDAEVGGVGGSTTIPVFGIEKLLLPTREGVELSWGSADSPLMVGILDVPGLEGVFGMDILSNTSWEFDPSSFAVVGDPNFRQLHFDFTDWNATGRGSLWMDVSPALDIVVPEPASMLMLLTALAMLLGAVWRRRRY